MSELEVAKEQIAYLKFWLAVVVVTDISLFGWLVSNANITSIRLLAGGRIAVVVITLGIVLLHRRIERQIQCEACSHGNHLLVVVSLVFLGVVVEPLGIPSKPGTLPPGWCKGAL